MNSKKRGNNIGDMISSIVMAGMALWIWSEAAISPQTEWRTFFLWVAGFASMAGAFRFQIATLVKNLRKNDH